MTCTTSGSLVTLRPGKSEVMVIHAMEIKIEEKGRGEEKIEERRGKERGEERRGEERRGEERRGEERREWDT